MTPSEHGEKKSMTLWLDKGLIDRIDKLAEKGDIPRNRLIVNLIEASVEDLEIMNTVGLWSVARIARDFRERLAAGRKTRKKEA